MSLLDVSLSQRSVQDGPGPSVPQAVPEPCPWPAGFPVCLDTWALSSCAHLLLLLGQEAVSTALLSCEMLLVKAL